mgnify:CR=1 FL=1
MNYKLNGELRVAISGKSGCGNTTVSGLLSKTLGIKLINYTFRQLAEEKGMTLAQVIEAAKNDDSYDKYVDNHQVELAMKESCVLGSRLAIWMLKDADLIRDTRVGKFIYYEINTSVLEEVMLFISGLKGDKND